MSCLLQECLDVKSFLDAPLDEKKPTLFLVFFCISQKNSTKAKETGSWLTVFSETLKNANILLHFATTLHKKGTCFQWNLKKLFFCCLNSTVSQAINKTLLTLYTLTSVCIFSILFSIHFLKCWMGEFV